MNCERVRALLDAYVDGGLAHVDREAVDQHLAECSSCREEEARLRALIARAAALPKSALPARDLWPAIRAEATPDAHREARSRDRAWSAKGWLAAAAVVIAVLLSATGVALLRDPSASTVVSSDSAPSSTALPVTGFVALEAQYNRASRELVQALDARRGSLAPQTIATVEQNLRIIDEAIREARAALSRDPGNGALVEILSASYRQKLDLLKRTAQLQPQG